MPQPTEPMTAPEDLCRLLAACYYEPGPDFAAEGLFEAMAGAARQLGPGLADATRQLREQFAAEAPQALAQDYTRLFAGTRAPLVRPCGRFWISRKKSVRQAATVHLLALYAQAGFEYENEFPGMPDHVAVELEFLSLLKARQNEALRAGTPEVRHSWMLLEDAFLGAHLERWIGGFAAAVQSKSKTAFYPQLARLTERFVNEQSAARQLHASAE